MTTPQEIANAIVNGFRAFRRSWRRTRLRVAPTAMRNPISRDLALAEQIKARDRVRLHGEPGEIESIHDPAEDPNDWYVETY
jgi:hypothetical protein